MRALFRRFLSQGRGEGSNKQQVKTAKKKADQKKLVKESFGEKW